jgi:choline kinase
MQMTVMQDDVSEGVSVLILAAGSGTRLYPYTENIPKCMVPLAGRPLVSRQLLLFSKMNLPSVSIVGGYKVDALNSLNVDVRINSEYEKSNMVWSMKCARDLFDGKRTVIVSYGDIIYERSVLEGLLSTEGDVVVVSDRNWRNLWALRMENPLDDAETFEVDASGVLLSLGKRASTYDEIQGQYIGLLKFGPGSHRYIQSAFVEMEREENGRRETVMNLYMTDFVQRFIDDGIDVHVSWTDGGWLEVDTATDKQIYEKLHEEGTLETYCRFEELV